MLNPLTLVRGLWSRNKAADDEAKAGT